MDKCQLQAPDYQVEAEHYKTLFTEAKEKNEYLCKELEGMKMALDKKSAELEEKQSECNMLLSCNVRLEGQVEAYQFCIKHWRDR